MKRYSFDLNSEWSSIFEAIRSSSSHPLSVRDMIIDLLAAYLTLHPISESVVSEGEEEQIPEKQSSPSPRRKRNKLSTPDDDYQPQKPLEESFNSPEEVMFTPRKARKPQKPRKR